MKIGIIGAGAIGATLAGKYAAAGHRVKLANSRGPASLADVVNGTSIEAVSLDRVVEDIDALIVSIPLNRVPDLPAGLFEKLDPAVPVVDTCNYYPTFRDGVIDELEAGKPESIWVSEKIGRPVVKAFNSIFAQSLAVSGRPTGTPSRIALPISGDDARAKAIVATLVDDAGYDAVDAGPLAASWRQEPGTPVYSTDDDRDGVRRRLEQADKAVAPERRDRCTQAIIDLGAHATVEDMVQLARATYRIG